jgi:hypothetical protein
MYITRPVSEQPLVCNMLTDVTLVSSILGFHYGYIPQIPEPTVGKYFADVEDASKLLWVPYPLTGDGVAYKKKETLSALCELSQLFRRLLRHNKADDMADGSPEDICKRVEIYRELFDLKLHYPFISTDLADSAACIYTLVSVYKLSHWCFSDSY